MKVIHCIGPRTVETAKKLKSEVPKMLKKVIRLVNFVLSSCFTTIGYQGVFFLASGKDRRSL